MTASQQVQACSYNQLISVVSSHTESSSNIYVEMGKLHGLAANWWGQPCEPLTLLNLALGLRPFPRSCILYSMEH